MWFRLVTGAVRTGIDGVFIDSDLTSSTSAPGESAGVRSLDAAGDVQRLDAARLGPSWRPSCPVGPDQLRILTVPYWGFDGTAHQGQLVVHVEAVDALRVVFARLARTRFPIRKMMPIDAYGGSDDASTADDNTSAFNCREAVRSDGVRVWSQHAYGLAVDVNPVENPYLEGGRVLPANASAERPSHSD